MVEWRRVRAFFQTEAAGLAGLRESTLRDWISTIGDLFVSERKAGRRFYSAEDILVLRIANEMVKGGAVTLLALAVAWEHCAKVDYFPEDALLAVKPGGVATQCTQLCTADTVPDWDSVQIIKLGRIAKTTFAACEVAYG